MITAPLGKNLKTSFLEDKPEFCNASQKMKKETVGTCHMLSCFAYRGPTNCINGKCICADNYFTEDKDKCIPCHTGKT